MFLKNGLFAVENKSDISAWQGYLHSLSGKRMFL
jgi:hypothetical protein